MTKHGRVRSAAAAALLTLALAACGGAELSAQDTGPDITPAPSPPVREAGQLQEELVEGRGPLPTVSPELEQDVKQLASQTNEDIAYVRERARGQVNFGSVAGRYGFRYKTYVSAGHGPVDGRGDHWVVFTERPPAAAFDGLATLGTDTIVMYGVPASGRELRRLSLTVMQSLAEGRDVFAALAAGAARFPDGRVPVPVRFLEGPPGGVLELQ